MECLNVAVQFLTHVLTLERQCTNKTHTHYKTMTYQNDCNQVKIHFDLVFINHKYLV